MDTYYRLVNGELVDVSVQLYQHHEQLEKERDEWKRKCEELCQAHGIALIELHDAKKEAVETAKFLQQNIYEVYDGKAAHMNDVAYKKAQAIINKAEGKG